MQSTSSDPAPSDSAIIRAGSDGWLRFTPAQRVDDRIVIVAIYQIDIVGVRVVSPRFHRKLGPPWS
jgi:hypothetical protein